MATRAAITRQIKTASTRSRPTASIVRNARLYATETPPPATSSSSSSSPQNSPQAPYPSETPVAALQREPNWLAKKIVSNESARYWFTKWANLLGYGSPKQIAGRRAFVLYRDLCATAPELDTAFWHTECDLPPTFQSWFTVTNLHVWMLTVRSRSLPPHIAKYYVQFLLDHFFIDVEDRIRAVLQPPPSTAPREPYTHISTFYVNPHAPTVDKNGKPITRGQAPERLVTRQLKIFKEQWMGMGLSFDLGLMRGDMDMAATVWRNILGSRGAQGISYDTNNNTSTSSSNAKFRRTVNLIGSQVEDPSKVNLEKEEARDDGSGVHDYTASEADKYLNYPELMHDTVAYVRRELKRLEGLSDEQFMEGDASKMIFGRIRPEKK